MNNVMTLKYGITERKKAELDQLTDQVIDAQHQVQQLSTIVSSLTQKSTEFTNFLAAAEAKRDQALSNKNVMDNVVQSALDLMNNSNIAFNEMVKADSNTKNAATSINDVINKLIYSAEIINKLANTVVRKKAMNPLISDELVEMVNTAGQDANNAVALTLTALKSMFAAQATSGEAEAATTLEFKQAKDLYDALTGAQPSAAEEMETPVNIKGQLDQAYETAKKNYKFAFTANIEATQELKLATSKLNKAQINLASLQSSLAAANAAALAS